jgi:hypothetical protein
MIRTEFERTSPESMGISGKTIEHLLDKLESGYTEPHGIMIMRHGKICAEGWWSPYAPGIRHGLQSHTKTYAATAVGIAYTEGLLKLEDRIIDIFKDEAPANPSENLKKLTVHHVLCMGCGMDVMPRPTENWIRDFLATPVNHTPGTTYMYNSTGSTLLGAIVRKITGIGLHDYLKPRLFDKIGINADNLRWLHMPDGMEIGGGGLFATTEDNLRLMKLYADGGVWNGERILAEDYVAKAISLQNESATEENNNPEAKDNFVGYGYQIWMCRPKGVYRADGAMGQFTIVVPDKDMIIAITENASGAHWAQKTLDVIWEFLDEITDCDYLAEDTESSTRLDQRMKRLALPNPAYSPFSGGIDLTSGKEYAITEGRFVLDNPMMSFMNGSKPSSGISEFSLKFESDNCIFDYLQDNERKRLVIAMDGSRRQNCVAANNSPISYALASGAWVADNIFEFNVRWIETCFENKFSLKFEGDIVTIKGNNTSIFRIDKSESIKASRKF